MSRGPRILVATDAWHPQVNGVVRSFDAVAQAARGTGTEIDFLAPAGFPTVPLPTYAEIRLALASPGQIARRIEAIAPDYVHIATEGPIGMMTRAFCLQSGRPFTTSFHTRFPEYLAARMPFMRENWGYAFLRWFHRPGRAMMVTTPALERELTERGFAPILRWSRGVDADLFRPRAERALDLPGPIFMYVGRVAVEKNLAAFLDLDLPGSKVVVGGGPQLKELEGRYRDTTFTGPRSGEDLSKFYASADVFVFPSRTDTLGLVMMEALACGVPVAAFPVTGPNEVIGASGAGVLDTDLKAAALAALDIPRERCREYALTFSWEESARQFVDNVVLANDDAAFGRAA